MAEMDSDNSTEEERGQGQVECDMNEHNAEAEAEALEEDEAKEDRASRNAAYFLNAGLLFGSIAPDSDLPISITLYLVQLIVFWNPSLDIVLVIHRGFTHSLFFLVPGIVITSVMIALGWRSPNMSQVARLRQEQSAAARVFEEHDNLVIMEDELLDADAESTLSDAATSVALAESPEIEQIEYEQEVEKPLNDLHQLEEGEDDHSDTPWYHLAFGRLPDTCRRCAVSVHFWNGCFLSMLIHALVDVVWMKGVKLLWPLDNSEIFVAVRPLGLFDFDYYTPAVQATIMAFDTMSESFFYIVVLMGSHSLYGATRSKRELRLKTGSGSTAQTRVFQYTSPGTSQDSIAGVYIFRFFYSLTLFEIGSVGLTFFSFAHMVAMRTVSIETLIVVLFVFGYAFIIISLFAPLIFIDAIQEWSFSYFTRSLGREGHWLRRVVRETPRRAAVVSRKISAHIPIPHKHTSSSIKTPKRSVK